MGNRERHFHSKKALLGHLFKITFVIFSKLWRWYPALGIRRIIWISVWGEWPLLGSTDSPNGNAGFEKAIEILLGRVPVLLHLLLYEALKWMYVGVHGRWRYCRRWNDDVGDRYGEARTIRPVLNRVFIQSECRRNRGYALCLRG